MALKESSREAIKNSKKDIIEKKQTKEKDKPMRVRFIPIWVRVLILIGLIFLSATAGAVIGYGLLGDGKAIDVFKISTWTHIIELVQGK